MSERLHPAAVLYPGGRAFPALPACDHYAGTEPRMRKALALQAQLGPVFDISLDCEDGAPAGREREHAELVAALINDPANLHDRVGVRVHDISQAHWRNDLRIIVAEAGKRLAYVTLPKVNGAADARAMIAALREESAAAAVADPIPVHVLIETHGALHEVFEIAALPGVECIDFGLMDFVSAHHGAIPASAMKSPEQFAHPLIVRAKCEIAAAALAAGIVPAHNVTTELKDLAVVADDACRAARQLGFLRMWSIHPDQILPIVAAMRPPTTEVERAAAILLAAQDAAWGPIRHEGQLHDRASYRYYWELLSRAHATGMSVPAPAAQVFFASH